MSSKLSEGYVQGSAQNLPNVDWDMIIDFIAGNEMYRSAELQGKKTFRFVV